jgi:hypothetical protein
MYVIFVAKSELPLGRPRCRWTYSFEMDRREIGWGGMDCVDLAQDRLPVRELL